MTLSVFSDEYFMKQAYHEAELALEAGEIPIGAVVVCNNKIIARTHNQTEMLNDVTAHAEMLAITAASNALGAKYLDECTVYVTLEPCPMCASALEHAHVGRVVWAADDPKNGFQRFGKGIVNRGIDVPRKPTHHANTSFSKDFLDDYKK